MEQFRLENNNGVEVEFLSHAGRIFSVKVPNGSDKVDIVLGGDLQVDPFMGALCGRFANRISKGIVKLEDEVIKLTVNEPPNHLHGGYHGFKYQNLERRAVCFKGIRKRFQTNAL